MNSAAEGRAERLVYLVDGDLDQALALGSQVGCFGYAVRTFPGLVEAREEVRFTPPTAAIVALNLADGPVSVSEFAGSGEMPFPVVFISKHDDLTSRLEAVRAGGAGFFAEPVDVPLLVDVLDQLTAKKTRVPERILVVDDDRLQANLTRTYLHRGGMEVRVVTDPLTAIEALIDFQPELVLLDMYMPMCTGMELAATIRQMEAFVSLPIVFLSAETDRDKQLAAVGLGGDDFLVKPIKPDHLISAVLSRTERYRKLRSIMMRDSLTGLYNHSTTTDRLDLEINRARRLRGEVSVAMLDIDHFKQVNDRYGHPVGDRVIKSLARLLTQRLRSSDIVGRYGGEEFLLILPDTPIDAAATLVDNLRQSFSKLLQRADKAEFFTTFSAGVASFPSHADNKPALKEIADQALYEAKRSGRNRMVAAKPPPADPQNS